MEIDCLLDATPRIAPGRIALTDGQRTITYGQLGSMVQSEAALLRLSSDHREVIVLREVEGFSYDEIADSLRVPRGTVESRLHRARGELRKLLQAYVP
jgi:RNA polymerase sigma-70 factor (ECF subfamily)